MINDRPPQVSFQTHPFKRDQKETPELRTTPKLHLKHLQTGGLIKRGQKVADVADKGAGVGSERPEVRANEKDGWWMVLIQEAATPLYLGSSSPTCLGDGLAVSRLFMDHRASPISYMPPKDYNSKTVTASPLIVCPSLSFGLIYFPAKKICIFFLSSHVGSSATAGGKKEGISFPPVDSFWKRIHYDDSDFQIYHPETYVRRERGEKREGSRRKGKLNLIQAYPRRVVRF